MAGKRVVVTGATAGIGEAMARSFAELGCDRASARAATRTRSEQSAGAIRRAVPGAVVIEEVCDVSDLDAVRAWCDDLSGRIDALHGLVHNAGAMPKERIETPQGHETQLACHVLGPQLMTERLLPLLRDAHGASVVFMSSGGMYTTPLSADDLESRSGEYNGVRVYARTKRMQVVLADAWAQRLAGDDIRVESMHPGWVETPGVAEALPLFRVRDQAVAARYCRRRRHRGVAGCHPARIGTGPFLARPGPAANDFRLAACRGSRLVARVPRRGLPSTLHTRD